MMLEILLALQNPHWSGKRYSEQFTRELLPVLLKKRALKEVQVLLGVLRSGKSTLFKLLHITVIPVRKLYQSLAF